MTREEALNILHNASVYHPDYLDALNMAIEALQQEPKQGKWINTAPSDRSDNIVCDQCGYDSIARYDYCPNCGARMETEK